MTTRSRCAYCRDFATAAGQRGSLVAHLCGAHADAAEREGATIVRWNTEPGLDLGAGSTERKQP